MCNDGYKGDGFVCVAEYNCNNIPELCDVNAHCTQNFGKYLCVCNQGMTEFLIKFNSNLTNNI